MPCIVMTLPWKGHPSPYLLFALLLMYVIVIIDHMAAPSDLFRVVQTHRRACQCQTEYTEHGVTARLELHR